MLSIASFHCCLQGYEVKTYIYIPIFSPFPPYLLTYKKISLSLTDTRTQLSPVVIKPMTFLRHKELCRRCFGPHVDTSAGNIPGIRNFKWCFEILVWTVWLNYKMPLQCLLLFHEHNSKSQYKNRDNKLYKEKAEEEQEFFFLKYCYAFWLTLTPNQILSNLFSHSFVIGLRKEWMAEKS